VSDCASGPAGQWRSEVGVSTDCLPCVSLVPSAAVVAAAPPGPEWPHTQRL
jgi:hypothetical protein